MGPSLAQGATSLMALPLLKTVATWVTKNRGAIDKSITKASTPDNLAKFTAGTRVEPITLVDQRLMGQDSTSQALMALSSLFTAYYLQAVSLLVNVGKVNTLRLLDSINPNRDVTSAAGAYLSDMLNKAGQYSKESFEYGLPYGGKSSGVLAFESQPTAAPGKDKAPVFRQGYDFNGDLQKNIINETAALSVGRLVNVQVKATSKDGVNEEASFPVMIRLMVNLIDSHRLAHILGDNSGNTSGKEMFHSWRAKGGGFAAFWRDIIMAQDLIDEHRKALVHDDSGVYADILERRRGNYYAELATKAPSINNAANLVVLSSATVRELEQKIGGRLDDYATRQRVFKSSYLLIMVIIDNEWDRVTFYTRDIKTPTRLSVKELKATNKGTGPDVEQILKAYQLGNSPTI